MTIAITLKVNDGVVLASDSASTISVQDEQGNVGVANVYNNANKIFNLRKGLPIGAVTWGSGSIGMASISTLMKDLRMRFTSQVKGFDEWKLEKTKYSIQDVAEKLKEFFYVENYQPAFSDWSQKPDLGFFIVGYSSGSDMAEEFRMDIINGDCIGPLPIRDKEASGMTWAGMPEAISRLVNGFDPNLHLVLRDSLGVPEDQIADAMNIIRQNLTIPLFPPAIPIQDAIDLAEFMVDLTIKFSRYTPGAPMVGGPIEIAAITKHEKFEWVQRKYYYSEKFNPREESS